MLDSWKSRQAWVALAGDALERALGRARFARVARSLWLRSRLDEPNDPALNGERLVQRAVCREVAANRRPLRAFDVGANVGTWSTELLRLWTEAGGSPRGLELFAFEPAPCTRSALESALASFGYEGVEVAGMALGATEGWAQLALASPMGGTNTVHPMDRRSPDVVTVRVTTLDAHCEKRSIDRVEFVKIDAEGADFEVLKGASGLLQRRAVRWLQFEYNHRWIAGRFYLRDVFDLTAHFGYRVGKITSRGIEGYPRWHPELETYREGNYLLWHDSVPAGLTVIPWWLPEEQQ